MEEKYAHKHCHFCGKKISSKTPEKIEHIECSSCNKMLYLNTRPCVSAIIIKGEEILLTKRGQEPYKDSWEFPGGFINKNETAEEALSREIREELGVQTNIHKYYGSRFGKYELGGIVYDILILYFIVGISGNPKINDEITDLKYFKKAEIPSVDSPQHTSILKEILKYPLQDLRANN